MGGSAAPTNTTSTVTQSNLPEYAAPYYQEILTRASQESNRPYERFEGQRTAEFSPDQQTTQQATMALQAPGQIGFGLALLPLGGWVLCRLGSISRDSLVRSKSASLTSSSIAWGHPSRFRVASMTPP